jgi:ribonuclease HII
VPSTNPQPERIGLDDSERLSAYARDSIANALLRASKRGWLRLDEEKDAVAQYHDLHDTSAFVISQLKRAGLALTPADEVDSLL